MNQVRQAVNVERAHRRGIRGQGITAAILDTGMCRHPDFQKRILYFKDFVRGREECYDDASHGTHVTGILGGDGSSLGGKYCGIAPECGLIHLKVLDRMGQGQIEHIIRAIQWIIDNQEHYDIRIMNLSAGADKGEEDTVSLRLVEWVEKAWDAGITVVVAAGNLGPRPGSVTVPGNSKKVITVGAADGFYAFGTAGKRKLFRKRAYRAVHLQAGAGGSRNQHFFLQHALAKGKALCGKKRDFHGGSGCVRLRGAAFI